MADRYRLERELGHGGMATVYLARDLKHGRLVAFKLLRPDLAAILGAERFLREIQLTASLQHPHILPLLDSGAVDSFLYYVMPYVEGESLRQRLEREGQLSVDEALNIARGVASALDYAHAEGVIHRDIKPENILLYRGEPMVADFGIALAASSAGTERLTGTGLSLGTPAYMSPEQASASHRLDGRSDQYSLACVVYEMLAGEPPFTGATAQAVIAKRFVGPVPSVRVVRPDVPEELDATLQRALAQTPAARFPTAGDLAMSLYGDAATTAASRRASRQRRRVRPVVAGAVAATLLAATLGAIALRRHTRPAGAGADASPRSLAVLPFVNVGGDTADRYFAEGMADELTTALFRLPGVRIAARSSAFRFGERRAPASEVGRALGVHAVLEGTVRRSGDRLRVTAQLTSAANGLVLWADQYDRRASNIFDVQDEITHAIVGALRGTLIPSTAGPPLGAPRGTADLEAYDLYLRGRFFWASRGEGGLRKAIDFFGRAVARDPRFARAHAGLAMAYVVLPIFSSVPADSALTLAERSAARALALDSTLADAHLALAYTLKMRWQWAESERHFHKALALAPGDAAVHHWYGVYLYATGNAREAVAELDRARELDPLSTITGTDLAVALRAAGRFSEGLAAIRRAAELDTTESAARYVLGMIHLALNRPDSALRAFEAARRLGTGLDVRPYVIASYRALGQPRTAERAFNELRRAYHERGVRPYDMAVGAMSAGDRPAALDALERAVRERDMFVTEYSLPCEPLLDPLKSEPRFVKLLARAGMRRCSSD